MLKNITYKQFGERAILIEWKAEMSKDILKQIISFKDKLQFSLKNKLQDCIIGYHSLTVVYADYIDFSLEEKVLKKINAQEFKTINTDNYLWEIPVCYNSKFGIDLEEISIKSTLSIEEIITRHSEKIYKVFFIGFLPGFLYLGELDKELHFPRKPNPRLRVLKGSVAIGGEQTGVYPQESSGGWNIIGNTPISFFDIKKQQPCFAKPEDKIKFVSVNLDEYKVIQTQIEKGIYKLSKTVLDD